MATILRHGGEAHVVRPDRVYRTGVLSPIVGYQPQADVQAVAAAFTLGPPSGTMLSGLGASGNWFDRLRERVRGFFAKPSAQAQQMAAPSGPPAPQAPGPTQAAAAHQLAPDQAGRAMAVFSLVGQPGFGPGGQKFLQRAARTAAERRYASLYWAG